MRWGDERNFLRELFEKRAISKSKSRRIENTKNDILLTLVLIVEGRYCKLSVQRIRERLTARRHPAAKSCVDRN